MDKRGGHCKTHSKAVNRTIKDYMTELELVDAWRPISLEPFLYYTKQNKTENKDTHSGKTKQYSNKVNHKPLDKRRFFFKEPILHSNLFNLAVQQGKEGC